MTQNRALRIEPVPPPQPDRDPAACLRLASAYLKLGGLKDAARLTALAAQIIEKKRGH